MKPINILFTSVGRRGYLLDYFRDALEGRGEIHAANSDGMAPAFLHADKTIITPIIYSPEYIDFLLSYCKKNCISAIVPLFDIDIPVLARASEKFASSGIALVVSREEVAMIANDKLITSQFLQQIDLKGPLTFIDLISVNKALSKNLVSFPLVVKPRWGMGSIGLYIAEDIHELHVFYKKVMGDINRTYLKYESVNDLTRSVIIQEFLFGDEYNLDVVNDLEGNYVTTLPKKKLAMRAGETDAAVTVDNSRLIELGARLASALRHIGNLDVDVIKVNQNINVIDINARFGGGYPFSHLAGADIPRAILAWINNEEVDPNWLKFKQGIVGVKDIAIRFKNGKEP